MNDALGMIEGFVPISPIRVGISATEAARHESFLASYRTIRSDEGRDCEIDDLLRFPRGDYSGRRRLEWALRRESVEWLNREIEHIEGPLRILDAGAGNCWLTRHLAAWGHAATALDINDDIGDGLGAGERYQSALPVRFDRVLADFSALPFKEKSFDRIIYNGSIHYADDLESVIAEAVRLLRQRGRVIVMDSPVYRNARSGEMMIDERGGPTRAGYITFGAIDQIAATLNLTVRWVHRPLGVVRRLGRLYARARLRREPASMPWIVLARDG